MKSCKGLVLLLSLSLLWFASGCRTEQPNLAEARQAPPEKVVPVAVEAAQPRAMAESFTLPGTLEAWEDLTLSAELAGPVRRIGPAEGEHLQAGREILEIDTETLLADYQRDRISFETKSKKLQRYQSLVAQQLVSRQELDEMSYVVEEARADLRHAQLLIEKSTLRTPVTGVLDQLFVDRGEYVVPGQALARIVRVDRLKVLVDVPEKDVAYLSVGDEIDIVAATINGAEAAARSGRIRHIAYTADPATRTYLAKIEIDNRDAALRPGKIVRAHFKRRSLPRALSVPLYALVERDGRKVVFVEQQGRARMVPVTTGAVIGARVVVEQGLSAGDRIIVKGQQLLSDGARVAAAGE
ncbi:MAG TPA: efflux RND transporter periplasmic adaptor subunit [Geopsychrobacteraceae bacterium]